MEDENSWEKSVPSEPLRLDDANSKSSKKASMRYPSSWIVSYGHVNIQRTHQLRCYPMDDVTGGFLKRNQRWARGLDTDTKY